MTEDLTRRIGPVDGSGLDYLESSIRADYEHCHPGDTLADLKRRARFSKGDKGLLRDWMQVARNRAAADQRARAKRSTEPSLAAA